MMNKTLSIELPSEIAHYVHGKPEAGMGYHIITTILKNGDRYPNCIVIDGCITQIKELDMAPFQTSDIESAVVEGGRWDFSK
jgi:hypothetical protein